MFDPISLGVGAATSVATPLIGKATAKAPPKQTAAMPMPTNAGTMGSNTANTGVSFQKPAPMTASSYAQDKLKQSMPGGGYG